MPENTTPGRIPRPTLAPRLLPGRVAPPQLFPGLARLASQPVTVLRPQDLLHVRFRFVNLEYRSDDGQLILQRHDPSQVAGIVMELPSQHIVERAFLETSVVPQPVPPDAKGPEDRYRPVQAVISNGSRIAVRVTDERIDYTLHGLLDAVSRLPLRVAPHALDPGGLVVAGVGSIGSLRDLTLATADLQDALAGRASGPGVGTGGPVAALGAVARGVRAVRTVHATVGTAAAAEVLVNLGVVSDLGLHDTLAARLHDAKNATLEPPTPRKPSDDETALELPWRLLLSPSPRNAFAHASGPVDHQGRTELWHSRLGVRAALGGPAAVDEEDDAGRRVRAIWTRDWDRVRPFTAGPDPDNLPDNDGTEDEAILGLDFRKSLTAHDRMSIVHLSSNFGLSRPEGPWTPPSVDVHNLMVSALGGWLDSELEVPTRPLNFSLEQWQHRATLGRDHFVKVVSAGVLFPFGHRASLVKITERRFDDSEPDDPAYLFQRYFIVVREPTRTYSSKLLYIDDRTYTDYTTPRRTRLNLGMPFSSVHLTTTVTPLLDDPDSRLPSDGGRVFFPTAAGALVDFGIVATDREGNVAQWAGPLMWVERDRNQRDKLPEVVRTYWDAPDRSRRQSLGGQVVAFARSHIPGQPTLDTEVHTDQMFFDAAPNPSLPEDEAQFAPILREAHVVVPAMSALAGATKPITVHYPVHYAEHGFDNNAAQVFLEVDGAPTLDFTHQADRSGGFVTPNLVATALSGRTGPIGGKVADAVAGKMSPADFFPGTEAKLFGIVSLPDLLKTTLPPSEFPAFRGTQTNTVLALLADLQRLAGYAHDLPTRFTEEPDEAAQAALAALGSVSTLLDDAAQGLSEFNTTAPDQLKGNLNALSNRLGAVREAVRTATALPSAVRNDVTGVTTRVMEHLEDGPQIDSLLSLAGDLIDGVTLPSQVSARLDWSHDLLPWPQSAPVFKPAPSTRLDLVVEVQAPTSPGEQPTALVACSLTPFRLQLAGGDSWVIALNIQRIEFLMTPGRKSDVNMVLGDPAVEFGGPLRFVSALAALIPADGFSDPPYVDVDASGIAVGFDLEVPSLPVGVMSLTNIALGAEMRVPFIGDALDFRFNFCTRENPFRLTVGLFGGGGFFAVTVTPMEVTVLEAAFEFGAAVALSFGVASGSVECMAGIYFRLEDDNGQLTGYFRLRGEVDVLGLMSASIELYLELSYEASTQKAVGRARLTIEVEVCFLSFSVEISCEKKFKGSDADPTFDQVMGTPALGGPRPWDTYCTAFAA